MSRFQAQVEALPIIPGITLAHHPLPHDRGERERKHRDDNQEQLDRESVLRRRIGCEGAVTLNCAPDGQRCHEEQGRAYAPGSEPQCRPEQEGQWRVEHDGSGVRVGQGTGKHGKPHGEEAGGKHSGLEVATSRLRPERGQTVPHPGDDEGNQSE